MEASRRRFAQGNGYRYQRKAAQLQKTGALLDRLVHRVVQMGARLAEPGEFTCRAFLAQKIDLPQAEGIAATIAAASDSQLHAAKLLRQGRLGRFAAELVHDLAEALALIEAGIDFTDQEDVVPIAPGDLADRLDHVSERLTDLLSHSRSWGSLEAMPRVVLAGPPSSGKSTLFNALLRTRRAVISATPGTTRDIITEPLTLYADHGRQIEIMLVDIAGLDSPRSALDHDIQAQARHAIERADLILQLDDRSPAARGFALSSTTTPSITIHTKSDLPSPELAFGPPPEQAHLAVSAVTGQGLDQLRQAIVTRIGDRAVSISAQMLALQPRHESTLHAAAECLDRARQMLQPQRHNHAIDQVELIADALRGALDELAALGGQMTPEDLLGRIFSRFCVGK